MSRSVWGAHEFRFAGDGSWCPGDREDAAWPHPDAVGCQDGPQYELSIRNRIFDSEVNMRTFLVGCPHVVCVAVIGVETGAQRMSSSPRPIGFIKPWTGART